MRNPGKIITVVAVATALAACSPPNEQPSDLPPGADPSPTGPAPRPASPTTASPTPGGQQGQQEPCTAEDVTVTEEGTAGGEGPQVTIPQGCAAPAEMLTRELREGLGPGAEPDGLVEFDYSMVGWSSGEVEEGTFGEPATMTIRFGEEQEFDGWEEALVDIKERGRRLVVVPADRGYAPDSGHPLADETIAMVVEVVRVNVPQ